MISGQIIEEVNLKTMQVDSRLCGRGKSTDMRKEINESKDSYKVLSPTKMLNKEQSEGLIDSLRIDSTTTNGGMQVTEQLQDVLSNALARVTCTTHVSGLAYLKAVYGGFYDPVDDLHLIIDEALESSIQEAAINVSKDAGHLFLSKLSFRPWHRNSDVFEISPKGGEGLENIASGSSGCDILNSSEQLRLVSQRIVNPLYATLIPRVAFERFQSKLVDKGTASFGCVSLLRPELFANYKSVRCLSAFFDRSEFAIAMSYQGVSFDDVSPVTPTTYRNSERLHIHYLTDEVWTRSLRIRKDSKGVPNMKKVMDFIAGELEGGEFIFNANAEDREALKERLGQEAVVETHGRNDLRHIKKAAFLGSRNLSPFEGEIISQLGIPRDEVDIARGVLAGYQFFMRSNLRVMDSADPVDIYCCDRRMVDFMLDVFPDAQVTKHDIGIQYENLSDARGFNGGRRSESGRKALYPVYFSESEKRAYRRYLGALNSSDLGTLNPSNWHSQQSFQQAS
ncbi:MAG: hypothetical protein CMK46_00720 [Porticoccus sp.]|nr:hypothetical protein [Porticoccus sp.]